MAHRIEVIAANRDNLSLIPGALIEERKKNDSTSFPLPHLHMAHIQLHAHGVHIPTDTIINNCVG